MATLSLIPRPPCLAVFGGRMPKPRGVGGHSFPAIPPEAEVFQLATIPWLACTAPAPVLEFRQPVSALFMRV